MVDQGLGDLKEEMEGSFVIQVMQAGRYIMRKPLAKVPAGSSIWGSAAHETQRTNTHQARTADPSAMHSGAAQRCLV